MLIDNLTWKELFDEKAIQRLAETVHAEARGEGEQGMHAVAAVIGNRIKLSLAEKGYNWGTTPEEIVTFGKDGRKQFSPWNSADPNNPILNPPDTTSEEYKTALALAQQLANGTLSDPTGGAEHFHAVNITAPGWTDGQTAVTIGNHQFYSLLSADAGIVINEAALLSPTERIQMAFGLAALSTDKPAFVTSLDDLEFDNTGNMFSYDTFYLSPLPMATGEIVEAAPAERPVQKQATLSQGDVIWNAFSNLRAREADLPVAERQSTYIAADDRFIPMMEQAADAQGLSAWQKSRVMTQAHALNAEARSATFFDRDINAGVYADSLAFYELAENKDTAFMAEQFGSMAHTPDKPAFDVPEEPLFLRAYATAQEHRPELVPYIQADRGFLKSMDEAYAGIHVTTLVRARHDYFDAHFASKPDKDNTALIDQTRSFYSDIGKGVLPAVASNAPIEPTPAETIIAEVVPTAQPSALERVTHSDIILPEKAAPIQLTAYADPWAGLVAKADAVTAIENMIQPVAVTETIEAEQEEGPSFHAATEENTDRKFKIKGSLSETIQAAAKDYGIDISGGKAWLLSEEVAEMNDIKNANRVRAGQEISIPRSVFAPA